MSPVPGRVRVPGNLEAMEYPREPIQSRVPGSLVPSSTRKLASYSYGEMEEESIVKGEEKGERVADDYYSTIRTTRLDTTRVHALINESGG